MWQRAVLIAGFTMVLAACSDPPFIELANPLPGQITEVGDRGFVVTTTAGERFEFVNANPLDPGMGQAHMRVHLSDRTPVLVTWRRDGYDLVAVKIGDGTAVRAAVEIEISARGLLVRSGSRWRSQQVQPRSPALEKQRMVLS